MFTLPIRIIIIVITAAYGSHALANGNESGYILLAAAAIFVIGYFRYGPIRPAYMAMRRGYIDVARKHIETIKFPKLLSSQSRAYLYWICGVIAAQDSDNLLYAEKQMRLAIDGSLRTSNDRCLAMATLAHIVAQNDDLERARQLLADAEHIPHRDGVSEYLKQLSTEFEKAK